MVPEELEDEDMMEMLNAGLVRVIIVDDWKARTWAQILPNVRVNDQAAVGTGGVVGGPSARRAPSFAPSSEAFYEKLRGRRGCTRSG